MSSTGVPLNLWEMRCPLCGCEFELVEVRWLLPGYVRCPDCGGGMYTERETIH